MGEVHQPGSVQFSGSLTLIEALARVGSTTERAGTEIVIVRALPGTTPAAPAPAPSANSQSETVKVDLEKLQQGALSQNVSLKAGDTVFVPRATSVFVSGQVKSAGEFVFRTGMTVRQAEEFFVKEGYQPAPVARSEAKRGTADATYGYYTMGKLMILKLREDYRAKIGAEYSLQKFHDAFIRLGPLPLPLIRKTMLGEAGRALE